MKVTVQDVEVFKAIELQHLKNYLQASGWYEDHPFLDNATIWLKQEPARGEYEILLPNKQDLGDYAVRIREIIATLEVVENRSQIGILSELITNYPNMKVQGVVMQINTTNTDKLSGKITLLGVVVDQLRKIQTELADHDYILAIKAYQERLPVFCTGDLIKENNTFVLKKPRQFSLDKLLDS